MRSLGTLLFIAAAVLFYLTRLDRTSPVALDVVELEQKLRFFELWSIAALGGMLLWAPSLLERFLASRVPTGPTRAGHRPAQLRAAGAPLPGAPLGAAPAGPTGAWREAIMGRIRHWEGGPGARILVDQAHGVPLTLLLEHLGPRHCERSVVALGRLLQTIPLPPRVRIAFDQCPEAPIPRHHLVARALGEVLPPSSFKAVASADQVDVMFFAPDPRWRTDW